MKHLVLKVLFPIFALMWVTSMFIPAFELLPGLKLLGYECVGGNLARIMLAEGLADYLFVLFMMCSYLFTIFLVINYYTNWWGRTSQIIFALFILFQGIIWVFQVSDRSFLLAGFWVWFFSLMGLGITALIKVYTKDDDETAAYDE